MTAEPGRLPVTGLPVERLAAADLAGCLALAQDRGWLPEPAGWRLLFELGEVYGVRDPAGGLAGSVALTRYGPGLAAVGMMLVAQRHGRQGLGRSLMTHLLRQAGDTVTCLFATGPGRPLYERLGFRPAWRSDRYIGAVTSGPAGGGHVPVRLAVPGDLAAIEALDGQAFGADRRPILRRLPELAGRVLVAPGPGGRAIRGYAASVASNGVLLAGPVIADDLDVATALIAGLADGPDLPLRIEVAGTQPGLARWAAGRGLTARSHTTVMTRGGPLPGRPGQVFGPFSVAMG